MTYLSLKLKLATFSCNQSVTYMMSNYIIIIYILSILKQTLAKELIKYFFLNTYL